MKIPSFPLLAPKTCPISKRENALFFSISSHPYLFRRFPFDCLHLSPSFFVHFASLSFSTYLLEAAHQLEDLGQGLGALVLLAGPTQHKHLNTDRYLLYNNAQASHFTYF